ncbi:MAG: hypothetical protein A3J40_13180 [Erythrobacter sp. RIFCSPHIGHO2_12_FULL_63_10]|nr:MAG: hypothetical protein A3J40_13180 [Erythrobacter sp. RIFCSPHIGHO2_12_FULL_63_10]
MPRKRLERNVTRARELRRELSLPEVLLWNLLRRNPDRLHFRRQHPLGNYILDFYCAATKVCIEIDGSAHDMGDRSIRDELRDVWLKSCGIEVLRVPATEVLESPEAVAEAILRFCKR